MHDLPTAAAYSAVYSATYTLPLTPYTLPTSPSIIGLHRRLHRRLYIIGLHRRMRDLPTDAASSAVYPAGLLRRLFRAAYTLPRTPQSTTTST